MSYISKVSVAIFCGLLFTQAAKAALFNEGSFLRTESNTVAIVVLSDDEVGLFYIKKRSSYSSDAFLLPTNENDQEKIRNLVSNTDVVQVAAGMKDLEELAANYQNQQARERLGFAGEFTQHDVSLSGKEAVIKINFGLSYLPSITVDFIGLYGAMRAYRAAPAEEKGEKLFYDAFDRSSGISINLYVPNYVK